MSAHIVERMRRGDHQAYAVFVRVYSRKAMSLAVRLLTDPADAEDALQDAFVKAWSNIGSFRADAHIGTWFYRIVYTTCLNVLARRNRQPLFETVEEETVEVHPNHADVLDTEVRDEAVREALAELPPAYGAIVDLFYVQECSYEQICIITGMPLGTVKTRLNRARTRLREAIARKL